MIRGVRHTIPPLIIGVIIYFTILYPIITRIVRFTTMSINDILIPKPIGEIRSEIPLRFSHAMIVDQLYDLNTGEKYNSISNYSDNSTEVSESELFEVIVSAFRDGDEIVLEHEIHYGEFLFRDYIVLNELFKPIMKWDLIFCISIFNGEEERCEIQLANKTKQEYYRFSTLDLSYKDRLLSVVKDLELVKLHQVFKSLGGSHEIPSRFTDLVQRAGWDNGIKIIKAFLNVLIMLQESGKMGRIGITTRMNDRIQTDDHDIIYKFSIVHEGYQLFTRHLIEEDTTSVRIFDKGNDESAEVIFEW